MIEIEDRPIADRIEGVLARAAAFDSSRDSHWCYHLQYADLVADPGAALAKIYSHFDAPMHELHKQRVTSWLQQKPQYAEGIHAYDPADFGWSNNAIRGRFSSYQQHSAIPNEG